LILIWDDFQSKEKRGGGRRQGGMQAGESSHAPPQRSNVKQNVWRIQYLLPMNDVGSAYEYNNHLLSNLR
jgi:hypothetical protein